MENRNSGIATILVAINNATKGVVKKLIKENWIGLILIFMIPLILLLVFFLPNSIRETLILHRDYSNIYDIFATHFVHEEFSHLISNVITYIIVALILYSLLLALHEKRLFYELFFANCLLIPFFISLIWTPFNKFIWVGVMRSFGFSGIVSSFVGAVIYAYVLFLHEKFKVNSLYALYSSISFVALLFGLFYITFTASTVAIISFVLIYFVWYAYKMIKSIDQKAKMELIQKSKKPILVKILPFDLYLLIFLFSLSLFPIQFVQENTAINFLIHYEGFIMGIAVSFMIHLIDLRKQKRQIINT
jgi:large-conductance mechanosensitive channel